MTESGKSQSTGIGLWTDKRLEYQDKEGPPGKTVAHRNIKDMEKPAGERTKREENE